MNRNLKRLAIGAAVTGVTLLATAGTAFAQEVEVDLETTAAPPPTRDPVRQPALDRHRRCAGDLHAGRLRPGRDRLLPGQARRPRGQHQPGHLLPGLRRLLPGRLPADVRRLQLRCSRASTTASTRPSAAAPSSASGDWVFLWKGGWAGTWFDGGNLAYTGAVAAFFLYMVAFMDTTATIPTGSMAERWKYKSFVVWGLFCGAIYYPLFGAWTWGGGWIAKLGNSMEWGNGYVDFAGSGVVHAMGGVAALAGAIVLGPRIGKFDKDGKPRALPGHHIPMAMLGTFILLFGWFGFNAASTFASSDPQFGLVAANTAIAGAFGGFASMLWIWTRTGKPDPAMMANGMLAGLVIITAPCAFVDPWVAMVLGIVAGVVVIEAVFFIERVLQDR